MYCSTCGTQSTQGLNYCNRCGATLNTPSAPVGPSFSITKPTMILGGLVAFITLAGFAALVGGAGELARKGFVTDQVMTMLFVGMATILIVDVLLLRQLSCIVKSALKSGANALAKQVRAMRDSVQTQRKLDAPAFEPVSSVTENTTRAFEPVYRETSG